MLVVVRAGLSPAGQTAVTAATATAAAVVGTAGAAGRASVSTGAGETPMVNNPKTKTPYTDALLGPDGGAASQKPSWRSRLARVPFIGNYVTDPEAEKREAQVAEQTKKAAASMPRRPGLKLPNPNLYIASPNITVDKFKVPSVEAAAETEAAGWWANYRESAQEASRNTMAVMAIKKEMDGFTPAKFEDLAGESYVIVNEAFYAGKLAPLRQLTTEKLFTALKREVKLAREAERNYEWSLGEYTVAPKIMQSRAFPLRDDQDLWAQITVKFESLQSLRVTSAVTGELIKAVDETPIVEYWVFERRLRAPDDTHWRICDRLI